MAEEITRILDIEVKYGDAIAKIAEYREAVAQVDLQEQKLQKQLEEGEITHKEYLKSMSALKIERKEYTDQIRILNKEVSNEIKKNEENQGSLKALRAELSNLTKQYDEMSRAEREGAAGKELQEHIMQVSNEIKQAEYATNRYYRNVGNYPKEVIAMIRDTTIATGSLKQGLVAGGQAAASMGKQLLKLMANPIVAFFAAIAAVVLSVVKAFNNSEERTNRLKVAMAQFEPVLNAISNLFGALADGITWCIEKIAGFTSAILDFIGINGDANNSMEKSVELEKARQAQIERTREFMVEEAQADADVAELRNKIAQKDKFNLKERLAMLDTAIRIEEGIAKKKAEIARENLRILQEEASQTENDAEMHQKLAEAKRAVIEADAQAAATTIRLQKQRASLIEEDKREEEAKAKAAADAAKKRADEAKKRRDEEERNRKEAHQKEMKALQDAEDAMLALVKDGYEKQIAQATIKGQREIDALKERLATEKNLTETAREAINQTIIAKEQELQNTLRDLQAQQQYELEHAGDAEIAAQRERLQAQLEAERAYYEEQVRLADEAAKQEMEIQQAKLDFAAQVFGGLASIAEQFADNNKAMAKLAKILALGEIAINTGKAIAAGVAQAQSVPFPANIGAIATTVATVLANMGTAISTVKSAKFAHGGTVEGHATGGYISGPGTGTSDSITARLSNGESVNTAMATSMFGPVLSAMNQMGGGVPINGGGQSQLGEAMLARAVAKGVAMMPRPVVSVEEINATSHRVEVIESLATL